MLGFLVVALLPAYEGRIFVGIKADSDDTQRRSTKDKVVCIWMYIWIFSNLFWRNSLFFYHTCLAEVRGYIILKEYL